MREYTVENNSEVDLRDLTAGFIPEETYSEAHQGLVISCHDAFIKYENGILLINRLSKPAKDHIWPIGGKIKRGVPTVTSLQEKVAEEAGLQLENIEHLGAARTYFRTDPFGHGRGTDTINQVYYGEGIGEIKLNDDHSDPQIVNGQLFESLKDQLHPYVRDFLEIALTHL